MKHLTVTKLGEAASPAELYICSCCGEVFDKSQLLFVETKNGDKIAYCEDCEKENTVVCSCCGKNVLKTQTETDGSTYICDTCYRIQGFTYCADCGRLIAGDEIYYPNPPCDEELCEDCYGYISRQQNLY